MGDNRTRRNMMGGCGDKFKMWVLSSLNLLDTFLGVTLLTYGFLVSLSHKSGSHGVQIYCISLGIGLLLSALFCSLGLRVPLFERYLLALGGVAAFIVSLVEFVSAFRIEFNQKNWSAYLRKYASELYLNEKIIQTLEEETYWLFCTTILLSVLELIKLYIVFKLREDLIEFENIRADQLKQPLLWRDAIDEEFCDSSTEFLPREEEWHDDDPLFWAKPVMAHQSPDLSWAHEDN